MPRLLPDGPDLAANADGSLVALATREHVSLWSTESQQELCRAAVETSDVTSVGFTASSRLLVVSHGADNTTAHGFTVPDLEPVARRDFAGRWRPLAFVGERMLLSSDAGEPAQMVSLTPKQLVADSTALRGVVRFAAPAPEDRVLIEGKGHLEFWDPQTRRALFRLNLNLTLPPRQAAFAAKGRLLWVASADADGRFEVFRFSDGRPQMQIELGNSIVAVDGQIDTSRVVLAVLTKTGGHRFFDLDLVHREKGSLTVPRTAAAFCMTAGALPQLVVATAEGELDFISLAPPVAPVRPMMPPAPAPVLPRDEPETLSALSAPRRTLGTLRHAARMGTAPVALEREPEETSQEPDETQTTGGACPVAAAVDRLNAWRARLRGTEPSAEEVAAPPEDSDDRGLYEPSSVATGGDEGDAWDEAQPPAPQFEPEEDDERPEAPAAPPAPAKPSFADRLGRLAGRTGAAAVKPPRATLAAPTPATRAPIRPVAPEVRAKASPLSALGRAAPRRPAPGRVAPATATATAAATDSGTGAWRTALVDWTSASLLSPREVQPAPLDEPNPVVVLAERLELDEPARRALALLYGNWLLGDGERGVSMAVLSWVSQDEAWTEARGLGGLDRLGLIGRRGGRVRLRAAVAGVLDGKPACRLVRAPGDRAGEALAGPSLVMLEAEQALDSIADRLAKRAGSDLAIIDPGGDVDEARLLRRLRRGLLEARLLGALPLVSAVLRETAECAERWLPLITGGALIAVEPTCPTPLSLLLPFDQ